MGEHMAARRAGYNSPDAHNAAINAATQEAYMAQEKGAAGSSIHELLPKIAAEIGPIAKTRTNTEQGYKFRGIEDILNACNGVFTKHGVLPFPRVLEVIREQRQSARGNTLLHTVVKVEYVFVAGNGSSVSCVTCGEGMDSGDKSANKAMTSAFKNALLQVLMVAFEADDSENESHELAGTAKPQGAARTQSKPAQQSAPPGAASARIVPYNWDAEARRMDKAPVAELSDDQLFEALDKARWTKVNKAGTKYGKEAVLDEQAILAQMSARGVEPPPDGEPEGG